MPKDFTQRGLAPIIIIIAILLIGSISLVIIKNLPLNQTQPTSDKVFQGSSSAKLKPQLSPTITGKQIAQNTSPTITPKTSLSPTPTNPSGNSSSSNSPTNTPSSNTPTSTPKPVQNSTPTLTPTPTFVYTGELYCSSVSATGNILNTSNKPSGETIYTIKSGTKIQLTAAVSRGNNPSVAWQIPNQVTGYSDSVGLFEYTQSQYLTVNYTATNHTNSNQTYAIAATASDQLSSGYSRSTGCPYIWLVVQL